MTSNVVPLACRYHTDSVKQDVAGAVKARINEIVDMMVLGPDTEGALSYLINRSMQSLVDSGRVAAYRLDNVDVGYGNKPLRHVRDLPSDAVPGDSYAARGDVASYDAMVVSVDGQGAGIVLFSNERHDSSPDTVEVRCSFSLPHTISYVTIDVIIGPDGQRESCILNSAPSPTTS